MQYTFEGGEAFSLLRVELDKSETIKAESNAMVAMSTHLELKGKVDGGILRGLARKFSGESFFLQNIKAVGEPGWVMLASGQPGDTIAVDIHPDQDLLVQKDGYLAATEDVHVSTKAQSISKGFFSREGFFVVKLSGQGTAFLSSYGSIVALELSEDEEILIDNGHLVAWDRDLDYKITKGASGWVSAFTAGEAFALKFTGPGRVFIQTRNPVAFGLWATPLINFPKQSNTNQ